MSDLYWTVQFRKSAKKELAEIADNTARTVVARKIAELETNAFPQGCKKINGRNNTWRIRVGNFRIIYEVVKNKLLIMVIKIGDRKRV